MQIKNTSQRYGVVAITLHWVMAIIIIGMLCLGLYMADLPVSPTKIKLYGLHKSFGTLVLMLVMVRIVWRLNNIVPPFPINLPAWQKLAAWGAHWAFYGFMFAMPLTGWLMSSASGFPVSFFGLFTLPNLIAPDKNLAHLFNVTHTWLAYGLILTFCAHVGAALKHHFINKDDVFRRMLP